MSLSDIDPRIDPGADTTGSSTVHNTTLQQDGTSLQEKAVNSEVDASAAVNAVREHPITQNVANGPVAQSVKAEAAQTSNEFGGLANSRQTPAHKAATGQTLTNYHSFFYTLLSWEHPRATGITFAIAVSFIFACRYLPVFKWILKVTWMSLGVVTLTEVAAKFAMGSSVAGSVRPRRYYTIPKQTLETSLDDLQHFINFFVIEVQRIVFAENIPATALAFLSAFVSYYLIKILPFWGLSLVFTSVVFLAPLIYITNKEVIDAQLQNASNIIGEQTAQVKDLTAQQTSRGIESLKAYTSDATAKASELVDSARQKIPLPANDSSLKKSDFPSAPTTVKTGSDFPSAPQSSLPSAAGHTKPIVHAPVDGEPVAVSSI